MSASIRVFDSLAGLEEGRRLDLIERDFRRFSDALEAIDEGLAGEMDVREALSEALDLMGLAGSDDDEGDNTDDLLKDQAGESEPTEDGSRLEGLRDVIKGRLADLQEELAIASERFQLRLDARRLAAQMPPLMHLELYMRYETMLERQLQRHLELLANVQRMRLLGPVGYRPVRALGAEQADGSSGDGAEAKS